MFRYKRLAIVLIVLILITINVFNPFRVERPAIKLGVEQVAQIGSFSISNSMIASALTTVTLVVVSLFATRRIKLAPGGRCLQNVVEFLFEALHNYIARTAGEHTRLFFPLAASLFLFILMSNWMQLLPGFGSFGPIKEQEGRTIIVPFLRSANSDLNTTLALAICSVLGTQFYGIRALGFSTYLSRFVNLARVREFFAGLLGKGPRRSAGHLMRGGLDLFIGALDIFGELTKVLSFSFRLFGNTFAGEVLLVVVAFLVPYAVSLPFMGLELFIGFVQAMIFMVLTVAFAARAVGPHTASPSEELPAGQESTTS